VNKKVCSRFKEATMSLLSISNDAKTKKGEKYGVLTGVLYLAPGTLAGGPDMCPHASPGCRAACLFTAGRGRMNPVMQGRIRKTRLLFEDPGAFYFLLNEELHALVRKSAREGKTPAVRLNGTSDHPFELSGVMERFPDVHFYDYTKNLQRMLDYVDGKLPANYHLTFSRTEANDHAVELVLAQGGNVAVVFGGELPATYLGRPVIDGDLHDIRFRAAAGEVIGLSAKGSARQDLSGFVVQVGMEQVKAA
jgi:hypothetical protein